MINKLLFFPKKIFCISFQRTGTTSVGKFFLDQGYRVASYNYSRSNRWTQSWFDGDYEKIFKSWAFKRNQVFEDDPWWCMNFYKYLYHRFPESRFILFTRDANSWFDSMSKYSNGKTLGNTYMHSVLYRRLTEYKSLPEVDLKDIHSIDNSLKIEEKHRSHYKQVYVERNQEVIDFFKRHDSSRLIHLDLEDSKKWVKLGDFFNIKVNPNLEVHENKSV